jgi:hypothetical protein
VVPRNDSRGVSFPTARPNAEDPVHPEVPPSGTFRPQGLTTLSTVCSPPRLAAARGHRSALGIAPFKALLLPAGGAPLGASPLLPFPRPSEELRPRLQRMTPTGKGNDDRSAQARATSEPCLPGLLPLQGFLKRRPSTGRNPPGLCPSWPFNRERSLRGVPGRGPPGDETSQAAWSHTSSDSEESDAAETACPPGVLHLAGSVRFFDLSPSRAHGFASADPIASAACAVEAGIVCRLLGMGPGLPELRARPLRCGWVLHTRRGPFRILPFAFIAPTISIIRL